jgi:thymidylate synthase
MKQYLDLLRHVLKNGEAHDDRTGVGTLSVFGYQFRHDMREGFPLLTTKKLPFRWIAEEMFWFLRGKTFEPELRAKGVDIWEEWATEEQTKRFGRREGDLGPVYGFLWRHFGGQYIAVGAVGNQRPECGFNTGVDQIDRLMRDLVASPNSRRHIVSGWDPAQCDNVALPPCHTLWQVKCHSDMGISLHLYARSIDSFLGLPFNIASYGLLLTLLAAATNRTPHDLIISFGDLHIYRNHLNQVEEQLSRTPRSLPVLSIRAGKEPTNPLARLMRYEYEDLELMKYDPYPKITAPVAV